MPWDWRKGKRLSDNDSQPGDCNIKGNIGRRHARIYHVPGGQYYARTRIDSGTGSYDEAYSPRAIESPYNQYGF